MIPQIAYVGYMRVPVPPTVGILRCEICGADIGTFDPEGLALPLTGRMFKAVGPGFPNPFPYNPQYAHLSTWEEARCPVCRKRPFIDRDAVMTPAGKFKVGDLAIPRKLTPEQQAAQQRQGEIDRVWTEEGLDIHEEINMQDLREMYPDKSQAELNQLMIDMHWKDEERRWKPQIIVPISEGIPDEAKPQAAPQRPETKGRRRSKLFRKGV